MPDIQRIPFHEDELLAIVDDRTGKEYVLPKPMADIFGLTWHGQLAKLRKSKLFSKGIQKMCIPSPGGEQEAVLLERHLVPAWLFSLDINRLSPLLQDKLLRYQEECAAVLDAYFSKGIALNPRTSDVSAPWDMLIQMAEAGKQQAQQIAAIAAEQRAQTLATIAAQRQALEALSQSARADAKADRLLHEQSWITIHQYVTQHDLERQMPMSLQKAYATYLIGYCAKQGYRIYTLPVAYQPWETENTYYIGAIHATLEVWLTRREAQIALVPKAKP